MSLNKLYLLKFQQENSGLLLRAAGDVFRMTEGLYTAGGGDTVSFESVSRPGFYVCNRGGNIRIERIDVRNQQ